MSIYFCPQRCPIACAFILPALPFFFRFFTVPLSVISSARPDTHNLKSNPKHYPNPNPNLNPNLTPIQYPGSKLPPSPHN